MQPTTTHKTQKTGAQCAHAGLALALLVLATIALVDLGLTLATMTAGGLYEGNPVVVAFLGAAPSTIALCTFKAALTAFGLGALWAARRRRSARVAAALCLFVYAAVLVQWFGYVREMNRVFTAAPAAQRDSLVVISTAP